MSAKRISLVSILVVVFATGLFLRGQLLSANESDLMHHVDAWSADQFHDPVPGKAYAFYTEGQRFGRSAVCTLEVAADQRAEEPERFQGVNLAGQSYNAALEGLNGFIGDKIIDFVSAKDTYRDWKLAKLYKEGGKPNFDPNCLQELDTQMMFKPDLIFIVETVYFRNGERTPFLVTFKPKPLVLGCKESEADCETAESSTIELPLNRFTKWKFKWEIIRFFRQETDVAAAV
jgi:hypothetical protein